MSDIVARLSKDGTQIVLIGYCPELIETGVLHTLPAARWHPRHKAWTCSLTPAAAWRVCYEFQRIASIDASDDLKTIATEFSIAYTGGRISSDAVEVDGVSPSHRPKQYHTKAWDHQVAAYVFAKNLDAALLAMDMGTGKSLVAVDLMVNWECRKVLVICPVSVTGVWNREFRNHAPGLFNVMILDKRKSVKQKAVIAAAALDSGNGPTVIVVNYESVWREAFAEMTLSRDWDCIVLDESHRIKGPTSKVGKFCAKLTAKSRHRLCLTGTPMPSSPLDLFGQFRFLDPGVMGNTWTHFRHHYARTDNPSIPQQVTGYRNEVELQVKMAMLTYRCEADDVLDLPDVQHHIRTCEFEPKARKIYCEMRDKMISGIKSGIIATASNALVRLLRLQQMTSGFSVQDETRAIVETSDAKTALLLDLLSDLPMSEPVVVYARFTHDLLAIRNVAKTLGRDYAEVSGYQNDLTPDSTLPGWCRLAGVQWQSGGVGVDFTLARYCIFYSSTFSLGEYDQALARTHRPGQRSRVNYYHLLVEDTVDAKIQDSLAKKRNVIDRVLTIFDKPN